MGVVKKPTKPVFGELTRGGIFAGTYLQTNRWYVENDFSTGPIVETPYNVFVAPEDLVTKDDMTLDKVSKKIRNLRNYFGYIGANLQTPQYPLEALEKGHLSNKWFMPTIEFLQKYVHPLSKIESLKETFEIAAKPALISDSEIIPTPWGPLAFEEYEFGKRRPGIYMASDFIPAPSTSESDTHIGMNMEDGHLVSVDTVNPTCVRLIRLEPI